MTTLEKRLTDIAHRLKLSHLSAYYTALPLIDHIYSVKKDNEPFILSQGHAFAALAVVLEKYKGVDAFKLVKKYMTHPTRNAKEFIDCSTGSLGQGLTIAVGMALADRNTDVYVLTSDGEMMEGCCWEALRIASDFELENLRIVVNANGYSAHNKVDVDLLDLRMQYFYPSMVSRTDVFKYPDDLQGINGHYCEMNDELCEEMLKV